MKIFIRVFVSGLLLVAVLLIGFRLAAGARETLAFGHDLPNGGRLIGTSEGAVFVLERGQPQNTPVVFAHGTAAWSGLWQPTLDAVSEAGFHAIAFDMPPFGWSEYPQTPEYDRVKQAERVGALLKALDQPPIIVAHSIGAGPVVETVMRRPDLVSGMIVVNGAIGLGTHESATETPVFLMNQTLNRYIVAATISNPMLTRTFLRGFIHNKSAATPERVALLQAPMQREGYTAAVAQWLPHLMVPPQDALSTRPDNWRALDLPVGIIWGVEDTVTPLDQAADLRALIPDAQYDALSGVGHIPQIESPLEFQDTLIKMLTNIANSQGHEAEL
ncbi:alpha/beta fold hydrolase [Ruegeria sp. HKCCA5426]|uniref:alpha/beta fold hydrolase n=1 Tax=Ruegeria sp. HKCCA5426 TaxID=2682985 RepID=UPI0014878D9A|nr:alpha/beta hydrolase [Ruegeria sp. HKCCA5426]